MQKFKTWVKRKGGAVAAAKIIGCKPITVYKWMAGERIPQRQWAEKIEIATKGEIKRTEWYW